jgi:small subunit ribosomal protein S10
MNGQNIRIRLKAFDHRVLDSFHGDREYRQADRCQVRGPIPLPTRIEKFTVQPSPHIDKKAANSSRSARTSAFSTSLTRHRRPWTR